MTVEELRNRLRQGKIYRPEKIEQALSNFFRKGNLSTLRELALRAVADEVGEKAASYRAREGLEPAQIPERVMVCMSSNTLAPRVIRTGARIAGRLGSRWYAVYVETPREKPDRINPKDSEALQQNIRLAESLGATVVRVRADRPAEGLVAFAQREGVTHVIFGQSARSRWEVVFRGSTLDRFLERGARCRSPGSAAQRGVVMSAPGTTVQAGHARVHRRRVGLTAGLAALAVAGAWGLAVAPALVDFGVAVAVAVVWCIWLERRPEDAPRDDSTARGLLAVLTVTTLAAAGCDAAPPGDHPPRWSFLPRLQCAAQLVGKRSEPLHPARPPRARCTRALPRPRARPGPP